MSNPTASIQEIFAQKGTNLTDQSYRDNSYKNLSNIKTGPVGYTFETLPDWLLPYAQNVPWRKRLAILLNKGYEEELRYFIENKITDKITKIFHYFNKCWGRERIESTVETIRKEIANFPLVEEVCEKIQATKEQVKIVRSILWRWGSGAVRHAVRAQEEGRDKFKYFCWLTSNKGQDIMRKSLLEQNI